jgi:hypothetical protein
MSFPGDKVFRFIEMSKFFVPSSFRIFHFNKNLPFFVRKYGKHRKDWPPRESINNFKLKFDKKEINFLR